MACHAGKSSGRQVWNHADQSTQSIQSVLVRKCETSGRQTWNHAAENPGNPDSSGNREKRETSVDRWEKNVKSCKASTVTMQGIMTGRQVGEKCAIMRTDKPECSGRQSWETSAKSCGPEHSEHPERTGRQGDKPEIMRAENPECNRRQQRQVGDKCESIRTKTRTQSIQSGCYETSGRQLRDKWRTSLNSWEQNWETCGRPIRKCGTWGVQEWGPTNLAITSCLERSHPIWKKPML